MNKYNILGLIANHTTNNIKYNVSINNISLIQKYLSDIVIIDSKNECMAEKLKNEFIDNKKVKDYIYIDNNNYFDFGKWIYYLENNNYDEYDYILFINDSIILTEDIHNYFIYINNIMPDNINLYGYNDSTQIKYHYQSYLFLIKTTIINKFINFFNGKKDLIVDLESLIYNIELNLHTIDNNIDCFIKIGNEYNLAKNLYWENDPLYYYLLTKNIFGIMKIKKIFDMQKEYKITIYGSNIKKFDYNFYRTYYDDLHNLSDNQLLEHFIENGQYEGRRYNKNCITFLKDYYREKLDNLKLLYFFDIPSDFDIYYYKRNYDDIKDLSNTNAMLHYIQYGFHEGRKYNKYEDKNYYLNLFYLNKLNGEYIYDVNDLEYLNIYSYIILNDSINDYGYMNALKHYLLIGKKNKLLAGKKDLDNLLINFDSNIYINIFTELNNLSNLQLIKHYIKYNKNNIYSLPHDFNYNLYKDIHYDLKDMTNNELKLHYICYGRNEGRIYKIPNDFDSNKYKNMYDDLQNMNNEELINHYLYYGYKENRRYKICDNIPCTRMNENDIPCTRMNENDIPYIDDFDCTVYKKIYDDLKNMNDEELIEHYLKHGHRENRIYKIPNDFDCTVYKKIYDDLESMKDEELIEHYLKHGHHENRIYKIPNDFNCTVYKKIYEDLKNMNDEELMEHYLKHGHYENRIYKIPNDFDCNVYKKIYDDLKNMKDEELIEHYLIYGYHENRTYKKIE